MTNSVTTPYSNTTLQHHTTILHNTNIKLQQHVANSVTTPHSNTTQQQHHHNITNTTLQLYTFPEQRIRVGASDCITWLKRTFEISTLTMKKSTEI
jgi:hypothetical protein